MKQINAMHGWAGDASQWQVWQRRFEPEGWTWSSLERGYGNRTPHQPVWLESSLRRVVICHSLGFHLIKADVLNMATDLVLLNSFSRFTPIGRRGRAVRVGLQGMADALQTNQDRAMLQQFWERSAAPLPCSALPPNPLLKGLTPLGRQRLRDDLDRLASCDGLPDGCPHHAKVLVIQADQDAIVSSETQQYLLQDLSFHLATPATVKAVPNCGHVLLTPSVVDDVLIWLNQAS